jgi:hypothetical protein
MVNTMLRLSLRMRRVALTVAVMTATVATSGNPAYAQSSLSAYLHSDIFAQTVNDVAMKDPAARTDAEILAILPASDAGAAFVNFVAAHERLSTLMGAVDALRLNKMIANAPGVSGTALVSRVAAS